MALTLLHADDQLAGFIVEFLILSTQDNLRYYLVRVLRLSSLSQLLLLRLKEEALAADWHVGFSTANEFEAVIGYRA